MINKKVVKQNFRIVWKKTRKYQAEELTLHKVWILLAEINRNEMVETNKS